MTRLRARRVSGNVTGVANSLPAGEARVASISAASAFPSLIEHVVTQSGGSRTQREHAEFAGDSGDRSIAQFRHRRRSMPANGRVLAFDTRTEHITLGTGYSEVYARNYHDMSFRERSLHDGLRSSADAKLLRDFAWCLSPVVTERRRLGEPAAEMKERVRGPLLDPNRLDIREFADAEDAQFAAMAGPFHAAEGQPRIGRHHFVDEHHAGFDLVDQALALRLVLVQALAPSPKRVSLAMRMASSRSFARNRHATGPKNSSL